jgi:hypothetical protein
VQENMSLKRLGVILYAVGHGRDPREALSQYEANATAFELEAGADYHAVSGGLFSLAFGGGAMRRGHV